MDVVKLRQDLDMLHLVTNQGEQVRAYLVDTDRVGSATVSRGWRPGRPQGQAPGAMLVPAANLVWPSVGKDITWVRGPEGQRSPLLILPDSQSDLVQRYFFGEGASNATYLFCQGLGVETSARRRNLPEELGQARSGNRAAWNAFTELIGPQADTSDWYMMAMSLPIRIAVRHYVSPDPVSYTHLTLPTTPYV